MNINLITFFMAYKVITINVNIFFEKESNLTNSGYSSFEYPELNEYLEKGYIVKETIPFSDGNMVSITFVLSKSRAGVR